MFGVVQSADEFGVCDAHSPRGSLLYARAPGVARASGVVCAARAPGEARASGVVCAAGASGVVQTALYQD